MVRLQPIVAQCTRAKAFVPAKGRGSSIEYFKFLKGDSSKTDVFENIDNTWKRFKETAKLDKMIADCIAKYNVSAPQNSCKFKFGV